MHALWVTGASSGEGGGHIPGRMMVLVSNIYYSMLFEIYMFTEEPYPNYTLIAHPSSLFWETWLWLDRQIIRHSQFHRKVLWNIFVLGGSDPNKFSDWVENIYQKSFCKKLEGRSSGGSRNFRTGGGVYPGALWFFWSEDCFDACTLNRVETKMLITINECVCYVVKNHKNKPKTF